MTMSNTPPQRKNSAVGNPLITLRTFFLLKRQNKKGQEALKNPTITNQYIFSFTLITLIFILLLG
jgi:hypothetical protein